MAKIDYTKNPASNAVKVTEKQSDVFMETAKARSRSTGAVLPIKSWRRMISFFDHFSAPTLAGILDELLEKVPDFAKAYTSDLSNRKNMSILDPL